MDIKAVINRGRGLCFGLPGIMRLMMLFAKLYFDK